MCHVVRKPAFCICENKGADQLHGNHYVAVQPCLRVPWSETLKTGFLMTAHLVIIKGYFSISLNIHVQCINIYEPCKENLSAGFSSQV